MSEEILSKVEENYDGLNVTTKHSGILDAGLDANNKDKTTSTEMIYFGDDGVCDYYSRLSSTTDWYVDNGYYNKNFYYKITGNTINVHLGEDKVYNLVACVSNDGDLYLNSVQKTYTDLNNEFLKTKVNRDFKHYEMKGNRTITKNDITVTCDKALKFAKNSKFSDSDLDIYLKINYKNDNFLKNVYVRFTESMFIENEFSTLVVTPSTTRAACYYNGVRFNLEYSVY